MKPKTPLFRRIAKNAIAASLAFCVFIFLSPAASYAANAKLPNLPLTPCPPLSDCHFYDEVDKVLSTTEGVITMALVMAALNAFTYMTQQLAEATAQFILNGGKGGGKQFFTKGFGGMMEDVGAQALNSFVSDMQQYVQQSTKFNICAPFGLQAFDLQLSIGIQKKLWPQKPLNCSFQQFTKNIEASVATLETTDLFSNVKRGLKTSGSDLGIGLTFQEQALIKESKSISDAALNRQEGGGMKLVTNLITGNVKTPAQEVKNTLAETNRVKLNNDASKLTVGALATNAFQIGIYQLPLIFGATLLNTLAVSGINALKDALVGKKGDENIEKAQLLNPFAQTSAEKPRRSVAFTDIVTPNLITSADQDFVHELSSCPTPRGLWGCAMDDGFAAGLRAYNDNGAFSVARASGIGTNGKGLVFLHSDWELIPESETKDNQDPGCYQRAYCASNLAKLRFARIIPVGWELAANSPFNIKQSGRYATFGEVIRGFSVCNDKGQIDATHPWCHLIDPTWTLTAPPFQCRVKGFGDSVIASQVRMQECSDVISCLERNNKGQCVGGYGYCLSEKTVWRFDADACLERFVSCRTYQKRNTQQILGGVVPPDQFGGDQISYLRNTIDYGSCNADNVGCTYYAATRDTSTTSTDRWIGGIVPYKPRSGTTPAEGPTITGSRVYFDANVQKCDASSDGCTKVLKIKPQESSLNLVKNGSFENIRLEDPTKMLAWDLSSGTYPSFTATSFFGSQGAEFKAAGQTEQRVSVGPLRSYVVSFYARANEGATSPTAKVGALLFKADGTDVSTAKAYYRNSATCSKASDAKSAYAEATGLDPSWKRFTCEFVSNADAASATVVVSGAGATIDGVQLEEADEATGFIDGENTGMDVDHIKLPPEELGCTGIAADRTECAGFAKMCKQADAGCKGYTDVNSPDQSEIPATVGPQDLCPSECVGYAEYRKLASAFDLVHSNVDLLDDPEDVTSTFFVPSKAESCTATDLGCEEFTNVEAAAVGGETRSAFSYIRACQKPNGDSTTYFTWEGSDTTGYQLRTWSLIRDNDFSPKPLPPKILLKAGPEGIVKDPALCTEASWKAGIDPDCRQIYDEKGNAFYKFFSQTIVSSPECQNYRKDNSDFADCKKTGGEFNRTTNECIYPILASQSASCPASAARCRAYLGTTGRNTATVLSEKFTAGTSTGAFVPGATGVDLSSSAESLTVGDHSLKIARGAGGPTLLSVNLPFSATTGTLYTLAFWVKTTDGGRKPVAVSVDGKIVGTVTPLPDWSRFEVGPFTVDKTPISTIGLAGISHVTYLDEVSVRRLQDVVFVKRDSWTVPAICDETAEGIPQPQAMLGCRLYKERKGEMVSARQFSHLCRYDAIGCTAYVDTRNSDDPYAQSFALKGMDAPKKDGKYWDSLFAGTITTTRPADRFVYAIDAPSAHCDASMESCRAFGMPKFNADLTLATPAPFETVYLKDDITKYMDSGGEPQMLCRPSELFCDRYSSQTPTGPVISYFRDPGDHACEWQDKVTLASSATYPEGQYSGWFVTGSSPPVPCYPEKVSKGNTFLTEFSGASAFRGWTDTCPEDQAECTEFRDPNDNTDQVHPQGRPYFFINNAKLDKESCAGQVDLLSGCVLFRDMTDSRLLYSTAATYGKSNAENGSAENPINCIADPTNPYCTNAGKCAQMRVSSCGGFGCAPVAVDVDSGASYIKAHLDSVCSSDAECSIFVDGPGGYKVDGVCVKNNSNTVVKVKLDRDCATWLGCSSGETVYDTAQGKYVDICTNLAVCDQGTGPNGKQFCAHYLDRKTDASPVTPGTFYESFLREGAFVDANAYSKRPTGFGKPDYSGYALPNHYQISDMTTRRVGYEVLANQPGVRDRYYSDFRMVARTPLYFGVPVTAGGKDDMTSIKDRSKESPYGAIRFTDARYPFLNLCQHKQTNQVGYYLADAKAKDPYAPTENPPYCYFAIDTPYTQNPSDIGGDGSTNPRNIQNLYVQFLQATDAKQDPQLTQAFPFAECKAYPETSSPFPNSYVKEWDEVSDPPKPKTYADGYQGAPVCEFGEDCACSYRKVSYGSKVKYYAPFSDTAPSGICLGGSRDGETCVPAAEITTNVATSTPPGELAGLNRANDTCGNGGTCQSIQTVSLIRGIYGQCLQRDASRPAAGSQESKACLVWNPSPILFGKTDVYHYQPTAGYLPPQNSGEYYCVANALPPKSKAVPVSSADWLIAPGFMESHKFHFDDEFVSDGDCFLCSGNDATFLDGVSAKGGQMGSACQSAKKFESKGGFLGLNLGHMADGNAARWIMNGRGSNHSYAEYFIGIQPKAWTEWLTGVSPATDEDQAALNALTERNFSYFSFAPINAPNERGLMGCGVTPEWVEGVSIEDYGDHDSLVNSWKSWLSGFNTAFPRVLSRESQEYLRTEDGAHLLKLPCRYKSSSTGSECFYKFWELGYRDDGEEKFRMQWVGKARKFDSSAMYFEQAQSGKPFFAIRAMFEDGSVTDNKKEAEDIPASGNKLTGPFRFVGWWVTASSPGTDERAIYMYMTIGHAEICKEVAQVVSPDTRENAAFQDRVSRDAGYTVPFLGYAFSSTNEPFGSAKHTRAIGLDPLFQVRGPMPGVSSKLKPPTFISAGVEYARPGATPAANWAWLTNLFARVYRVYRYYDQAVSKESWACVTGPKFGSWCPDLSSSTAKDDTSRKFCGYSGTCTGPADQSKPNGLCNALSGVNAGLSCSSNTTDPIEGYHVCHNAPVQNVDGVLTPLYLPCELQKGWSYSASRWHLASDPSSGYTTAEAKVKGAFRCMKGSVTDGISSISVSCSSPSKSGESSVDCPRQVIGGTGSDTSFMYSQCKADHCSNGFEHALCKVDADCEFTWAQWWGSYNADKKVTIGDTTFFADGITLKENYGFDNKINTVPWWSSGGLFAKQITPGTGDAKYAKYAADVAAGKSPDTTDVWQDIGGKDLVGSAWVAGPTDRTNRFPGAYAGSYYDADASKPAFIPAHCEKAPESDAFIKDFIYSGKLCGDGPAVCAGRADRPYAPTTYYQYTSAFVAKVTSGYQRYYGDTSNPWKQATCEGGPLEGRNCSTEIECTLPGTETLQEAAKDYCHPVSVEDKGTLIPYSACQAPPGVGSRTSDGLDTDDNLCTHNPGYYPRMDLCGNDPLRSQCLTGVQQRDPISINPKNANAQPPTDVTAGLYTPRYLAAKLKADYGKAVIDGKAVPEPTSLPDDRYVSYYTPRPPVIAAPDTSRQCPSSGSCPIAKVNAFTFENQVEGAVPFVGGQALATIRFYGWAADNQGPVKDLWVDWGDGVVQEIHDAQMKNKKPYCGGTRECQFVPGLTCNSDSDCPPAGGKCADVGFCKAKPNVSCSTDEDCSPVGSLIKDRCAIRTPFGDSKEACEQNYFEFTHAYACGSEARKSLGACVTTGAVGRCGRNNAVLCSTDAECGSLDRCLKGTAKPGGCFDSDKAACRYTPRVLAKDNWGWCTGECRIGVVGGKLAGTFLPKSGSSPTTEVIANGILFPNGGCYDSTRLYQNTDPQKRYSPYFAGTEHPGANLCDPASTSPNYSPWVVFQGALQLGITQ